MKPSGPRQGKERATYRQSTNGRTRDQPNSKSTTGIVKSKPATPLRKTFSHQLNWKAQNAYAMARSGQTVGRVGKKLAGTADRLACVANKPSDTESEQSDTTKTQVVSHTLSTEKQQHDQEAMDTDEENETDDDQSDDQSKTKTKPSRRPIKPKGKKGKKFADQSQMLGLIDALNVKEEETIGKKLAKRAAVHKIEKEKTKRILQRKQDRKKEMAQVKKNLVEQEKNKRKERKVAAAAVAAANSALEAAQLAGTAPIIKRVRFEATL
ncbi:hypothetical protein QVD99_007983 [Batrachochytrium dendrobatidis]|nr:hypothetical protein O5D80_004863 [Batrachochytrium dendrobatidis]KAK5665131.1 hypothetical protein QVD99_007983 [Batrachochytrium dendrobatidis]